ncbi:hypothetical protein PHLCEN_2v10255 [Hermanssonia centrifuga]|uniref:Uncharacterized protein n=1 Tax=Hermanssonia centrifuga TaxID=98765 RepID=A0A2R6NNB7_9APHY|nr:hypothetical protein PHLCEN_2v10255 [Hermanssonia centrifuga]
MRERQERETARERPRETQLLLDQVVVHRHPPVTTTTIRSVPSVEAYEKSVNDTDHAEEHTSTVHQSQPQLGWNDKDEEYPEGRRAYYQSLRTWHGSFGAYEADRMRDLLETQDDTETREKEMIDLGAGAGLISQIPTLQ